MWNIPQYFPLYFDNCTMLELLALQYSQSSPLIDVFVSCSVIEYEILNLPILLLNFHLKIISYFGALLLDMYYSSEFYLLSKVAFSSSNCLSLTYSRFCRASFGYCPLAWLAQLPFVYLSQVQCILLLCLIWIICW